MDVIAFSNMMMKIKLFITHKHMARGELTAFFYKLIDGHLMIKFHSHQTFYDMQS